MGLNEKPLSQGNLVAAARQPATDWSGGEVPKSPSPARNRTAKQRKAKQSKEKQRKERKRKERKRKSKEKQRKEKRTNERTHKQTNERTNGRTNGVYDKSDQSFPGCASTHYRGTPGIYKGSSSALIKGSYRLTKFR